MNGYNFFTPTDARHVRTERIRQLEFDHFNALLLLEEDPDSAASARVVHTVHELERRIAHHVQALTIDDSEQPDESAELKSAESERAASQGG